MARRMVLGFGVGEGRMARFLGPAMALGFAALVAAGIAAAWSTARNEGHTRDVNHTYEVELAIDRARIAIEQGETTRRGYLLTGEQIYLDTYRTGTASLPGLIARLTALTADNPVQQRRLTTLRALTDDLTRQRERTIAIAMRGDRDAALGVVPHRDRRPPDARGA